MAPFPRDAALKGLRFPRRTELTHHPKADGASFPATSLPIPALLAQSLMGGEDPTPLERKPVSGRIQHQGLRALPTDTCSTPTTDTGLLSADRTPKGGPLTSSLLLTLSRSEKWSRGLTMLKTKSNLITNSFLPATPLHSPSRSQHTRDLRKSNLL